MFLQLFTFCLGPFMFFSRSCMCRFMCLQMGFLAKYHVTHWNGFRAIASWVEVKTGCAALFEIIRALGCSKGKGTKAYIGQVGAHFKALIISKSAARSVFTSTQVAISRKLFQCGYIFNRERAFLPCGSFHASWNCNSRQIYCYIWSRHLAFYLCGSFHVC